MPLTYSITYETVTPESAAEGEAAEYGYIIDGNQYPIADIMAITDKAERDRQYPTQTEVEPNTDIDDLTSDEALASGCQAILTRYCATEPSCHPMTPDDYAHCWFTEYEPDVDYATGAETRRAVHFDGMTREIFSILIRLL